MKKTFVFLYFPFIILWFFQCTNEPESSNPFSNHTLDCSQPTAFNGTDGSVVEIFNSSQICVFFKEYPGQYLQYLSWDGKDYNGEAVSSGVYKVKISLYRDGHGSAICTQMYIDNETVPPESPKNLKATPGNTIVSLHWDPVLKATSYRIYFANGTSLGDTPDSVISQEIGDTIVTGLINGSTYTFAVRAKNAGGLSPLSEPITITLPIAKPSAPINVTAISGNKSLTISWGIVKDADAYDVYYKKCTGWTVKYGDSIIIDSAKKITVTSQSVQLTDLTNCETYTIGISATNKGGYSSITSLFSSPALPNPSHFSTMQSESAVFFIWDAVAGAKSYNLLYIRGLYPGYDTTVLTNVVSPTKMSILLYDTAYYAYVKALDSSGTSCGAINKVCWFRPMYPPKDFSLVPKSQSVNCTWEENEKANMYRLYFAKRTTVDTNDTFIVFNENKGTVYSLINGVTYAFAVRAVSIIYDTSLSALSNTLTVIPMPTPPDSIIVLSNDSMAVINYKTYLHTDSFSIYYNEGNLFNSSGSIQVTVPALPCTIRALSPKKWYSFTARRYEAGLSSCLTKAFTVFTEGINNFRVPDSQAIFTWDTVPSAIVYQFCYMSPTAANPSWFCFFQSSTKVEFSNTENDIYAFVRAEYPGGFSLPSDTLHFLLLGN